MIVHGFTESGSIRVVFDGDDFESVVPNDMTNRFRQMITEWEAAGHSIPAYQPPTPTVDAYRAAIQSLVDQTAQSRKYDSGNSLASYAASTNQEWSAEAQAFIAWRDQVWAYAYAELDRVQSGAREQPTVEQLLGELEPIEWPASSTA